MPRNILVVGKGRPFHTTQRQAELWIQNGNATWDGKRRVKYIKGKNAAPKLRGLSCLVGVLVEDLRCRDTRDYAETFLRSQLRQRERSSIENGEERFKESDSTRTFREESEESSECDV